MTVLYQVSNHKSDEGNFNAFEMPRNGAGVNLALVKRHCHALRLLNHVGVDGFHWRVRMDDKAQNSREASFSWWDIQDENARLPLKNVGISALEEMFTPKNDPSNSTSSSSSGLTNSSAMKGASGAMRSLGKAMTAVTNTVEAGLGRDDREDPNEPRIDVIIFKLLDLVVVEDTFAVKHGTTRNGSFRENNTPMKINKPANQHTPQQQQQHQSHPRQPGSTPTAQRQQRSPHPATPSAQAEPSLMDFVSGGAPSTHPQQSTNPRALRRATSSISPNNRAAMPPRRFNSSMPPSYDSMPLQEEAPKPKLTRVQKLVKDRNHQISTTSKVWDEVDQRYVVVDPNVKTNGKMSEPPPPPKPQQKIVGIKIDASNAIGKSRSVQAGVQERVKDMEDAQRKALQELKEREVKIKQDADKEDIIRKKLEPKLRAWSEEYGKKKQLRALLGSLHIILWKESGWKPVSMGDLIDEKKVRRAYLKASLRVHPDKTRDLDVEKRFIAKRVFDALSQAKTDFENTK